MGEGELLVHLRFSEVLRFLGGSEDIVFHADFMRKGGGVNFAKIGVYPSLPLGT